MSTANTSGSTKSKGKHKTNTLPLAGGAEEMYYHKNPVGKRPRQFRVSVDRTTATADAAETEDDPSAPTITTDDTDTGSVWRTVMRYNTPKQAHVLLRTLRIKLTVWQIVLVSLNIVMSAVLAMTAYALPFGTSEETKTMAYWQLVIPSGTFASTLILHIISLMAGGPALFLATSIFWIVNFVLYFISSVLYIYQWVACGSNVQCAQNLGCDGTTLGVYSGGRPRFVALGIETIICTVLVLVNIITFTRTRHALQDVTHRTSGTTA
jgi:hypothetical protein